MAALAPALISANGLASIAQTVTSDEAFIQDLTGAEFQELLQ
jgi:hypothetical protein